MEGLNSGAVTAPFTAAKDSDCIIVIGARPAENHPVAATFLKNAAKRGAKLIVMDPRGQNQGIARFASHVLQFTPGRDVALLNAMLHTIIDEGMVDVQYVQAHTEGFEALKEKVKDFAPEAMARAVRHPRRHHHARSPASTPAPSARSSSGAWASRSTPTAPTTRAA